MKRKIDLLIHSINVFLLVMAALLALVGIVNSGAFIFLLILQFFTGCFQYPVSLILAFANREPRDLIRLHAILSTFYLAIFIFLVQTDFFKGDLLPTVLIGGVIPSLLAILFFYITYLRFRSSSDKVETPGILDQISER